MKKLFYPTITGIILFIIMYRSVGIIRMPANDMKNNISQNDILLYRKFLLYPNHNDIIIYKYYYSGTTDSSNNNYIPFIQRVIALPGDTLIIDSNKVYINHKPEEENEWYQKNYIIQLNDTLEQIKYLDNMIDEKSIISKKLEYAVSMSQKIKNQLLSDSNVVIIESSLEPPEIYEESIYPYNEQLKWNKHFFGPLYIPQKNDILKINKKNLYTYFPIIQNEEPSAFIKNDSLFINNKKTNHYQFKNNYYFVMGDNRDNAIDSRYTGPIKQSDIIGIVFWNTHLQ